MTPLMKTVKRSLIADNRYGGQLIVQLNPGDEIEFRTKGRRQRYSISLHNVFVAAVGNFMQQQYKDKMKAWEARGKRGRKPSPPNLSHFPQVLRMAINTKG